MLEVKNVKVYDLKESVIACRNAMRLDIPEYTDEELKKVLKELKSSQSLVVAWVIPILGRGFVCLSTLNIRNT